MSSVSYWWTSSSKKSKPKKALISKKKHQYCAMVKLAILRETTSNRTVSIFFNPKSAAQEPVNIKIGTFYWINNFLYFFEWGMQWTRKIKTVTWLNRTAVFYQTAYRFLIVRRPFYGTEFKTLFCLLLYKLDHKHLKLRQDYCDYRFVHCSYHVLCEGTINYIHRLTTLTTSQGNPMHSFVPYGISVTSFWEN